VIILLAAGIFAGFAIILPLGIKWEFEKKGLVLLAFIISLLSWGIAVIVNAFIDLGIIGMIAFLPATIVTLFAGYILFRFFRDPDRRPRGGENHILSPADGKIIYVKKIDKGLVPVANKHSRTLKLDELTSTDVLTRGVYHVGISMTFLDVHVNRAPVSGRIVFMKHVNGSFLSLKEPDAEFRNERVVTVIERGSMQIGIVQIASRLVRRIVPFKKEGEEVRRGEKIGMIRFGSQVDLVIPGESVISLSIKAGDRVKAGESIIAEIRIGKG
jgi:phosphatidylserine decarboxylase